MAVVAKTAPPTHPAEGQANKAEPRKPRHQHGNETPDHAALDEEAGGYRFVSVDRVPNLHIVGKSSCRGDRIGCHDESVV